MNITEFINQRSPSEKILGVATAAVLLFAIVYGIVVGPILSKMVSIDSEIMEAREEIRRNRRIISFKSRILGEYSKTSNYLDSTEKSSEEIIAALLKKIESVAKEKSITIKDIRPGDTEDKPQYKVYKTSLECEGTLDNVLGMMNTLEQSDYLFQITRYNFEPKSKGADILKASMDVARFLIPAEKMNAAALADLSMIAQPDPATPAPALVPSAQSPSVLSGLPDLPPPEEAKTT